MATRSSVKESDHEAAIAATDSAVAVVSHPVPVGPWAAVPPYGRSRRWRRRRAR